MNKNIRLLSILEQLLQHRSVNVNEFAILFSVSQKSIQNDFKILKSFFDEKLIKDGTSYTLLEQENMARVFKNNPETTRHFLRLVFMVDSKLYNDFTSEYASVLKNLNLTNRQAYQIVDNPYEKLKAQQHKFLDKLEEAIVKREYISIAYALPNLSLQTFHHAIPLKIIYLGSNWYLATLTTNNPLQNHSFRLLRINFISKILKSSVEPLLFHNDNIAKIEADNFLKTIQSSFSTIKIVPYEVLIKIDASKSRYFQNKKYLSSQRIIKELEEGSILVSYMISNDMEIIPIIQRWIPFIKVIKPLRIRDKIIKNIEQFMKGV